ncbi:MAG: type II toxin-antitoxin system Phd/YefM family antitoxin [Lachnospiraceae bacterium]|nr:type II toxin-antitoxin system Phd/YefM family antitoxin [Lachnospiraceae bacterium]MDE7029129.1 type II toxin-antitoxin system Phd/YefM family antitoxin [Lachnospiraceae bacterium]
MKDLVREMDFTTLKNNFDEICDEINSGSESAVLTLASGRKVFILPEKNYDSISHIVMVNTSENALH